MWPRREQQLYLERLEALFCEFCDEEGEGEDADDEDAFWEHLGGAEDAAKAKVIEDRVARVWSMLRSDWITDCLSNLSRTEMVCTMSSKDCGSKRPDDGHNSQLIIEVI